MLPPLQLAEHLSVVKVQSYSAKGSGVGAGRVSLPTRGGGSGGVGRPEDFSFEHALKVSLDYMELISGTTKLRNLLPHSTNGSSHFLQILKTDCKGQSALIRALKIERRKN